MGWAYQKDPILCKGRHEWECVKWHRSASTCTWGAVLPCGPDVRMEHRITQKEYSQWWVNMNVSCLSLRNYSDTATSKGQGWELFWHFDFRELNCDPLDIFLSLWLQLGPVGQVLYSRSVPSWWDMPRRPVHVVADCLGDCKANVNAQTT